MKKFFRSGVLVFLFSFCMFLPPIHAGQQLAYPDLEPEISMDFKDADMKDILKLLSVQSGLNFIASGSIRDRKVTLYLDKVPLEQAMVRIFRANNLAYEFDRDANIFIVKDLGESSAHELITRVFYLTYATVSSSSIREEMKSEIASTSGAISQSGLGSTASASGSSSSGGGDKGKWTVEEDAGITKAVRQALSQDKDGKAIGTVIEDFRTNSLIISDLPSRMPVIAALIASLDKPVAQVMLEVEMLDVSKNLVDEMGFDWTNAASYAIQIASASRGFSFPFLPSNDKFTNQAFAMTPGTLSFPTNLKMVLDFLRTQTDTKYLARPRLLTLNNETAEIKIATNEVIGETVTYDDEGNASSRTAERSETGVMLRVTPQIDLDRGEILMFLTPKVVEAATSAFSDDYRDPETRQTKTLVKVKDGETVIVGGLIRNQLTNIETKLPFLGDIPVLGAMFRHKNKSKDIERELLVFITPRIIRDTADADIIRTPAQPLLPEREQSSLPAVVNRQVAINSSLNRYDSRN